MSISIHSTDAPEEDQDVHVYPITGNADRADISLLNNGLPIEALNLYKDDYYNEERPDGSVISWILPHSKQFPKFIQEHFMGEQYFSQKDDFIKKIAESKPRDYAEPFPYQNFVYEYLRYGTPNRSLLLEHGLGAGKSRSAILVAESFREKGLPTLILTPAFLKLNMLDEIERWGAEDIRITEDMTSTEISKRRALIAKNYLFVHYNATGTGPFKLDGGKGGVFEALARLGLGFPGGSPQAKAFPYIRKKYGNKLHPPQRMLIIIEEAHGLNRSFISGAGSAETGNSQKIKAYLYTLLMQAVDCKIIALTGTPMISNPFELAPLYNILRGPITTSRGTGTAFPLDEKLFNDYFVDYEDNKIINQETFMSRILGLGSYFKGITDDKEGLIYPTRRDYPVDNLPMSAYQTHEHDILLSGELKKKGGKKKKLAAVGEGQEAAMSEAQAELNPTSSYRTGSRQACNYVFPQEIPRPRKGVVGTWEDFIAQHSFDFQVKGQVLKKYTVKGETKEVVKEDFKTPDTEEEMLKVIGFLLDVGATDEEEAEQVYGSLVEDYKVFATAIIARTYTEKEGDFAVPLKPPRGAPKENSIYYWLSPKDIRTLKMYMGELKDRLQGAMAELVKGGKKYLSLRSLKTKYSIKMATIYERITGDLANGACRLVYDGQKDDIAAEDAEADVDAPVDGLEFGVNEDGTQGDREDDATEMQAIADIKPEVHSDPDDPLPKYMDVFKTDEELREMGARVVGGPALVYSFFNTVEGAGIFSKILDQHGFTEFRDTTDRLDPKDLTRSPRYAFIRGAMDLKLKINIMRIFNSRANVHGQLIRVVFVTQAAAEGISLFNLRQIHIMEPFWDNVMIEQVEGRGFRIKAHQYIEHREDRYITVYKYVSVRPDKAVLNKAYTDYYKGFPNITEHTGTTDQYILDLAIRKDVFREEAKLIRARAAVDCVNNSAYNELKAGCFMFRDLQGRSYTLNIEQGAATETKVVGSKKLQGHELKVAKQPAGVRYFTFEDEPPVQIAIKNGDKAPIITMAELVYVAPYGWKDGDAADKSTMRVGGYRATFDIAGRILVKFYTDSTNITRVAQGKAGSDRMSVGSKASVATASSSKVVVAKKK